MYHRLPLCVDSDVSTQCHFHQMNSGSIFFLQKMFPLCWILQKPGLSREKQMTGPGMRPGAEAQCAGGGPACTESAREGLQQSARRGQKPPDRLFTIWFTMGDGFRERNSGWVDVMRSMSSFSSVFCSNCWLGRSETVWNRPLSVSCFLWAPYEGR